MPKISVIMGAYNCADTLGAAIDSILGQTEQDWELILCDDGSRDAALERACGYSARYPEKIFVLRNQENMGLNASLNKCLAAARGRYIARMDGDDVCAPERFARELEVLEGEAEIGIVSTDMELFDEGGVWGRASCPSYPKTRDFMHGSPFCHAPCMVKREAYDRVGGHSVSKKAAAGGGLSLVGQNVWGGIQGQEYSPSPIWYAG